MLKSGSTPTKVIATQDWVNKNVEINRKLNKLSITIVTNQVLASAVSTKNPDGVAALVEISSLPNYLINEKDDLILVLDRIQDPGNLGNLFRTALAGGVNKILLSGGAHPLGQKAMRASCGAVFHLPFRRIIGDEEESIKALLLSLNEISNNGFQIISTSIQNKNADELIKPYWELNWSKPTALILGNEGSGIHKKIKEAFNDTITIPHSELVESLNVACVAVPLLLERKRVAYISNKRMQK